MQLGHAVEGWLAAHDHALSPSTRQDIEEIGVAITMCGLDAAGCDSVGVVDRATITAEAVGRTTLNQVAIGEFLNLVIEWVAAASPAPSPAEPGDELPSDTDGWQNDDLLAPAWTTGEPAAIDGLGWADERPVVDDRDLAQDWADELSPIDAPVEDEPADEAAELVDEDDLDDDELAEIDDDLMITTEDQLDDDELRLIDDDLDQLEQADDTGEGEPDGAQPEVVIGVPGDAPQHDDPADPLADPAASSFLQTIGQSAASSSVFEDLGETAAPEPIPMPIADTSGVFSEAAQYDTTTRSIDWLTVTYFVVAAICFGFVIYFYLSS